MPGEWARSARCALHPEPDLWHPERGEHDAVAEAKDVCRGCPVIAECGEHALRYREPDGIWGGLTATERRHVRREGASVADAVAKYVRGYRIRRREAATA